MARIEVDGLKEFNRAVRRSTDTELPKRIGQANRRIGQLVIDRLQPRPDPAAVGEGGGAAVRASAAKREVLLRVGGAHRKEHEPYMRWGRRPGPVPFGRRPKRPYISETVERNRREIETAYLKAIREALADNGPMV